MKKLFWNILAVVAGFFVGSVVNMSIVMAGPLVIPPPEGVNLSDMEQFAEALKQFSPRHFIAPWLAHALGTFCGAFVAAATAASHRMLFAMLISVLFLLGGIAAVSMFGGPLWFILLDLVGAYLPMGFLGGQLALRTVRKQV